MFVVAGNTSQPNPNQSNFRIMEVGLEVGRRAERSGMGGEECARGSGRWTLTSCFVSEKRRCNISIELDQRRIHRPVLSNGAQF